MIDNKCASKKWINDNYNNIIIANSYTDNQLVKEKDITATSKLETIFGPISNTYENDTILTSLFTRPLDKSKPFEISFEFKVNKVNDIDAMIFCSYNSSTKERTIQLMWYTKDWGNTGIRLPYIGGYVTGVSFMNNDSNITLGVMYPFKLTYDGEVLTSYFNGKTLSTPATLTKDSPFNFMVAGSPHASSGGNCNITFKDFIIKN